MPVSTVNCELPMPKTATADVVMKSLAYKKIDAFSRVGRTSFSLLSPRSRLYRIARWILLLELSNRSV